MSLTFDIKDIKNKGAVRIVNGKIAGTTRCLVTGTIWVGLNRITEENVEQWLYRCSILRKHGYELGVDEDNPDKKWWPSQETLVDHIGLTTNARHEETDAWLRRINRIAEMERKNNIATNAA